MIFEIRFFKCKTLKPVTSKMVVRKNQIVTAPYVIRFDGTITDDVLSIYGKFKQHAKENKLLQINEFFTVTRISARF